MNNHNSHSGKKKKKKVIHFIILIANEIQEIGFSIFREAPTYTEHMLCFGKRILVLKYMKHLPSDSLFEFAL